MPRVAAFRGAPTPIQEGQVFDETYRLVRFIGEGGMGRVFEATHARLAGRYAIKVLLQKLSTNPDAMARFNREARITSSLQHPNIVQVVDFNTAPDGTEYLVMEYLGGESLAARIARQGPQSLETVVDIVDQVAAGLAAAHGHGVIHRDLKPDNVFLVPVEGRTAEWAKILDFGISKVHDGNQAPGGPVSAVLGTPLYMAPEQCQGRSRDVDAATDQFALAAITYELLTGRAAFAGQTVGDVLSHVVHDDPPPMALANARVEAVVRRGLAKSNVRRFPSVTAFADALRAAATGARMSREIHRGGTVSEQVGELSRPGAGKASGGRNWVAIVVTAGVIMAGTAFGVQQARQRMGPSAAAAVGRRVAPAGKTVVAPVPEPAVVPAGEAVNQVAPAPARPAAAASVAEPVVEPVRAEPVKVNRVGNRSPVTAPRRRAVAGGRPVDSVTGYPLGVEEPAVSPPPLVPRGTPPTATPAGRVTKPQSPPRKALILDDDATLPLDESIADRALPL